MFLQMMRYTIKHLPNPTCSFNPLAARRAPCESSSKHAAQRTSQPSVTGCCQIRLGSTSETSPDKINDCSGLQASYVQCWGKMKCAFHTDLAADLEIRSKREETCSNHMWGDESWDLHRQAPSKGWFYVKRGEARFAMEAKILDIPSDQKPPAQSPRK